MTKISTSHDMSFGRSFRRGQIVPLLAVFLGLLFGFAGLALDVGYLLITRSKLVTALDAASMAAIRSLSQGSSQMGVAAQRAFAANLPAGHLLMQNPTLSSPTVTTQSGMVQVRYTATASLPTFFMRWFGYETLQMSAETVSARRKRNVILVMDYSGSVLPSLPQIRLGAQAFVNTFVDNIDEVGLVTFSSAGKIDYAPQMPFKADLLNLIDNTESEGWTNHTIALFWAYKALVDHNQSLEANEIVFFTDGQANWYPAQFNVNVHPTDPDACISSPVEGNWGQNGNRDDHFDRIVTYEVPPAPVITPPVVPECPNWAIGEDHVVASIEPIWTPPFGLFPVGIPLAGYAASNPPLQNPVNSNGNLHKNVAANTVDNLARLVRHDANLNIRIHTIGFQSVAPVVMERIANCEGCPGVDAADAADPTQSKGTFVFAASSSELMSAFLEVAGFIGRIVQ